MKKKILFLSILLAVPLFFISSNAFSVETPVRCQGDRVEYLRDKQVIQADGNVVLSQTGTELRCDKAIVFVSTGEAFAEGKVVLTEKNHTFTADNMHYNFKTGLGDVVQTHFVGDAGFAQGESGTKVSSQEFILQNAYITTCDLQDPHYKIFGRELRIYPGDRVVIRRPTVYIHNVPVAWFPRYTYPLNDERTRFSIAPGYRSDFGFFTYSAYNFYQSENIKGTLRLDYREKRGIGTGADVEYQYENESFGKILTYVIDDREYKPTGADEGSEEEDTRYRVTWEHQQQISYDTRLISEFNVQSDKDIIRDFFRSEFRDENQRENFIDITKSAPDYQMTLFLSTQVDDVFNVLERLPEFRLSTRKMRIQDTPIFYTSTHSLSYLNFDFGEDRPVVDGEEVDDFDSFRMDNFHEFSYPKKYLGWLSFEPRLGFRTTAYSDDVDGDSQLRGVYNAGFDTFTKISRTWDDVENEFWDVHKLRHVIEPAIQYTIVGHPSVNPDDLLKFDGIDSIDRDNRFRLSLRNKLQTQRSKYKTDRNMQTVDLVDVELFTFLFPQHSEMELEQAFSDIFVDFETRPIDWLKFDIDMRIDTEETSNGIEEINTDLVYYYDDALALVFGQRFRKESSNLFVFEVDYQMNPDWQLKVFQRVEAESGDLQDSEFALLRDLHDWKAVMSYRHREFRNEDTFFVLFYLKDFPDLPLKIGN